MRLPLPSKFYARLRHFHASVFRTGKLTEKHLLLTGRANAERVRLLPPDADIERVEFSVSSQWGEDGILQWLLAHVPIPNHYFVEFGVEDYRESNTRFLAMNNLWRGLIMDGDAAKLSVAKADLGYSYDVSVLATFITRENINDLLRSRSVPTDIGVLSIDIDGNDYWVWEAIEACSPRIVIVEYNNLFGSTQPVTIPYDAQFQRTRAHYSNMYFGASLAALAHLGGRKGYSLIGCTSAANDAIFVRNDCRGSLRTRSASEAYRFGWWRDARNPDGSLTYASGWDRVRDIVDLPLVNVATGQSTTVSEAIKDDLSRRSS